MARRYSGGLVAGPCLGEPMPEPKSGFDPDDRGRDRVSGPPLADYQGNHERDASGRITTRAHVGELGEEHSMPAESGLTSRRRCGY